jgi:hypothetical protein
VDVALRTIFLAAFFVAALATLFAGAIAVRLAAFFVAALAILFAGAVAVRLTAFLAGRAGIAA